MTRNERALRRAVLELSEYGIEDIEAIWCALSPAEKDAMRPLLAQASNLAPEKFAALQTSDERDQAETPAPVIVSQAGLAKAARWMDVLPDDVSRRVWQVLEPQTQQHLREMLPPERQPEAIEAEGDTTRMTARARAALRLAVQRVAAPPKQAVSQVCVSDGGRKTRFSRWFRRTT